MRYLTSYKIAYAIHDISLPVSETDPYQVWDPECELDLLVVNGITKGLFEITEPKTCKRNHENRRRNFYSPEHAKVIDVSGESEK
ncbi:unnamed protein product [Toxocara canis]|uniref:Transposase n=1 Tax=Toxocara canis TaxID=6265 RepID=A0A183U374_TOXCA|nr:unnamed protein product [Toxocara canis]